MQNFRILPFPSISYDEEKQLKKAVCCSFNFVYLFFTIEVL